MDFLYRFTKCSEEMNLLLAVSLFNDTDKCGSSPKLVILLIAGGCCCFGTRRWGIVSVV